MKSPTSSSRKKKNLPFHCDGYTLSMNAKGSHPPAKRAAPLSPSRTSALPRGERMEYASPKPRRRLASSPATDKRRITVVQNRRLRSIRPPVSPIVSPSAKRNRRSFPSAAPRKSPLSPSSSSSSSSSASSTPNPSKSVQKLHDSATMTIGSLPKLSTSRPSTRRSAPAAILDDQRERQWSISSRSSKDDEDYHQSKEGSTDTLNHDNECSSSDWKQQFNNDETSLYSSSSSSSSNPHDDVEEPESTCTNATTHRAVVRKRRNPNGASHNKPQTPRERWVDYCCCYGTEDMHADEAVVSERESCGLRILRFLRLRAPGPQEHPVKKKIRYLLWWTLLLDLTVALIAMLSYTTPTTCCGEPILAFPGVNMHQVLSTALYIYLGFVLAQILPVVREGLIPWNLMNPIVGCVLGFFLFVNDSPIEALSMWILQILSVALEFVTYRLYGVLWSESKHRFEQAEEQLAQNSKKGYEESRLQRTKRDMKRQLTKSLYRLRKHMIGVLFNTLIVIFTLLLIVYLARKGGMCIQDHGTPNLFSFEASEMECSLCEGHGCQICDTESGEHQCYFAYF